MVGCVYIFLGKEDALKEEALNDLKREALSGGSADLNCSIFYADQIESPEFQDAVTTQPFFSPAANDASGDVSTKRFVVIRDIHRLVSPITDSIISYCKNPSSGTVLVLTSDLEPKEMASRRGDFFSSVSGFAKVVVFERLKEDKLVERLRQTAVLNKKTINDEAIELLIEKLGDNLTNLKEALEGLVTYLGERTNIEKSDVEALIGKSIEETVFTLTKAVYKSQTARSLSILSYLLRESVKPETIIGTIGAELRKLLKVKSLMAEGKNQWHIRNEARLSQQAVNEAMEVAAGIKLNHIKRSFEQLLKADYECKNTELDKKVILESLIVSLSDFSEMA